MEFLFRSFLYAWCLVFLLLLQYSFLIFRLDVLLPFAAAAFNCTLTVARRVRLTAVMHQVLTCTPKYQLCLLAASITVANIWHVLTPFYAICGWIGSPRGLLLLMLSNAVASSPLSSLCISTSWHQVQKFIVPLSTLVAVTKRSYRGDAIPAVWNAGYRRYVRLTVPWIVRCIVLMLLIWLKTKHASSTTTEHECLDELPSSPPPLHFDHCETRTGDMELKDSSPRRKCTDFYGKPLPCSALDRARLFNMFAMPS